MASMSAGNGNVTTWIDQQQRRIQQLEAENLELRRQLDNLRRGVGLTLVIEGRAIPLAPQPQPSSSQPGIGSPAPATYAHSNSPALTGSGAPWVPTKAAPKPTFARPRFEPIPTGDTAPFAEDAWLSDSGSAVVPPSRVERVAPTRLRQTASSQDMTPSWLREDPPSPRYSQVNAAGRPREVHPAQAPTDALPSASHAEAEPLRTLAQITGHQQAARQRSTAERRDVFSDSFVLG